MEIPNLAGVATQDLVEKIGGTGFAASYINWSRTMQLLRDKAPGWLPVLVASPERELVHKAPIGGFLLIAFRHVDGQKTEAVPQAIMDNKNNAIPYDKITARDITDTHRRGVCMAAALTFGLAYELWAKMPLESGYAPEAKEKAPKSSERPAAIAAQGYNEARAAELRLIAGEMQSHYDDGTVIQGLAYVAGLELRKDEKAAVWQLLSEPAKKAFAERKESA